MPTSSNTVAITPPVQLAIGSRKLSQSHLPRGFKVSTDEVTTSIAEERVSRKSGIIFSIVNPAIGSNTLFQNHSRPSPIFSVNGSIESSKPLTLVRSGEKSSSAAHSFVSSVIELIVPRISLNISNIS